MRMPIFINVCIIPVEANAVIKRIANHTTLD
jgi:hypothetical protein